MLLSTEYDLFPYTEIDKYYKSIIYNQTGTNKIQIGLIDMYDEI